MLVAMFATANADLTEMTHENAVQLTNGSYNTFVAFVNPVLPKSVQFHPVLHEINAHFSGHPDVRIVFVDADGSKTLIKKYGVKELPTLLFFHKHVGRFGVPILFDANFTAQHYIQEIEGRVLMSFTEPAEALREIIEQVRKVVREAEQRDKALASARADGVRPNSQSLVVAADSAAAYIEANGNAAQGVTSTAEGSTLARQLQIMASVVSDLKARGYRAIYNRINKASEALFHAPVFLPAADRDRYIMEIALLTRLMQP